MFDELVIPDTAAQESLEHIEDDGELLSAVSELMDSADEFAALESLDSALDNLDSIRDAIALGGLTKSLVAFADQGKCLSSTVSAIPAVEAMASDFAPGSAEAIAAQEGVLDTIKDTVARWAKAAWDTITGFAGKLGNLVSAGWKKATEWTSWFAGKTRDAVKGAGAVVQAHPYATVAAVLTAFAAAPAVITAIWAVPLPATHVAFASWISRIAASLKSLNIPGRALTLGSRGKLKVLKGVVKSKRASLKALGYAKDSADKIISSVKTAFASGGPVSKLAGSLKDMAKKAFEFLRTVGKDGWGYARRAVSTLLRITWSAITSVYGWGMNIVTSGINAVKAGHLSTKGVAELGAN